AEGPAPENSAEGMKSRKQAKHNKWLVVNAENPVKPTTPHECKPETEIRDLIIAELPDADRRGLNRQSEKKLQISHPRLHCRVSRVTGATGAGALYKSDEVYYLPGMRLAVFAGLADDLPAEGLKTAFERLGLQGYGRDASSGLGRFTVESCVPFELAKLGAKGDDAWYVLGPCVPEKGVWTNTWFQPFVRFGRHGDVLARSRNPFKNPVIMADEGAVLAGRRNRVEPYVGTALTGLSFEPETVGQGYALCLPIKVGEVATNAR
ncbi:MAG TPA: hypothetical protein PKO06_24745, partial [Candidatus Ozemobacteraceae bacterium]|nr:hypothetical protein [Candidatus Ozemobacteraceae bacterium]